MAKAKTLDETMKELNDVITALEAEDISLEESFRLYNSGLKLVKSCNDSIDKIEKKMVILNENGEENEL